jgi:transposase
MKELGIIRRMYYRAGLSLSEIERRAGFTRKTIRNWLKAAEATEPKYRRRTAEHTKIAPYATDQSTGGGCQTTEAGSAHGTQTLFRTTNSRIHWRLQPRHGIHP